MTVFNANPVKNAQLWWGSVVIGLCVGLHSDAAYATPANSGQGLGTKAEAKEMLEKVVTAVQADKSKALESFKAGASGFKDRDLYPYCGGPDGNFTAHPTLTGKPLKGLTDKSGQDFGTKIYEVAAEGQFKEVKYQWPRPGTEEPVQKVAIVTKVADQVCAVGYYL